MGGSDTVPSISDRDDSASPSQSEELDTDSQPSASMSDRAGTSQEAWPDVEDSRYYILTNIGNARAYFHDHCKSNIPCISLCTSL